MARRSRKRPANPSSPVHGAPKAPPGPLAELKKVLAQQARERAHAEAIERAREAEARREQALLDDAFEGVTPLAPSKRAEHPRQRPSPRPIQRERDEQDALQASFSDDIDIERYLDTDDSISYAAPGIGVDVLPRLLRGHWAIGAQIDLHGLRSDEAREALVAFLEDSRMRTLRCVRVIHGKGLGSANRQPVLKGKVRRWLTQRADVLAFCQARPTDGGAGALIVLLAGPKRKT